MSPREKSDYKTLLEGGGADDFLRSPYERTMESGGHYGRLLEESANPYFRSLSGDGLGTLSAALATQEIEHAISRQLAEEFNVNSTKYDRAIDEVYVSTGVGGSSLHHNLDGSHTFAGAVDALRKSYPDDPEFARLLGGLEHLARDFTTPSGINPFLGPDSFVAAKGYLEELGLGSRLVNDLLNVNASELALATLASGMLAFGGPRPELPLRGEQLGRLLGTSFFAGNPFGLLVAAAVLIRTTLEARSDLFAVSSRGALGTGQVIAAAALLPELPLAISLIVTVSVCGAVRHLLGARERFEAELDHALTSRFAGYRSYFAELR